MFLDIQYVFQILSKILLLSGEIAREEWDFFLKGATVLDRTKQPPNPAPIWISEEAWDNITALVVLSTFENIVSFPIAYLFIWHKHSNKKNVY